MSFGKVEVKAKSEKAKEDLTPKKVRREMIRNYFENHPNKLLCVHILAHQPPNVIPTSNSYDIRGILDDLKSDRIIERVRRESCAYRNYPHDTFKFVPKGERKKKPKTGVRKIFISKKPTQERTFQAISSRYSVGDTFSTADIRRIWKDKWHRRLSSVLHQMAQNTNLLEPVGKDEDGNNLYKLKKENYEDREWTTGKGKEVKVSREKVFEKIADKYSVGDTFLSKEIAKEWTEDKRTQVSGAVWQLANKTNLIDKIEKKVINGTVTNTYKLKESDYSKREAKKEEPKEEKAEFERTVKEEKNILQMAVEEIDGKFCIHDIRPIDLERNLPNLLTSLENEGVITRVRDDYECEEYGQGHRLYRVKGMEEEEEVEEEPKIEVEELGEPKEKWAEGLREAKKEEMIEVPEKEAILLDKYYKRRKNLLLLEILREIVKKLD